MSSSFRDPNHSTPEMMERHFPALDRPTELRFLVMNCGLGHTRVVLISTAWTTANPRANSKKVTSLCRCLAESSEGFLGTPDVIANV